MLFDMRRAGRSSALRALERSVCASPAYHPVMDVIALAAIVVFGTLVEGVLGFGFAPLFVPAAALVVSPRQAVAVSLVLGTLMGAGMYWEHRPRVSMRSMGSLVAGAMVGTPVGYLVL